MTKIKICGLYRSEDIRYVNQVKPDWCGFIINFPKSHRSLAPEKVRSLRRELDDAVVPVGVFVNQPVDTVVALLNDGTVSIAQLHGQEDAAYIAALPGRFSGSEPFDSGFDYPGQRVWHRGNLRLVIGRGHNAALAAGGQTDAAKYPRGRHTSSSLRPGHLQQGGDGEKERF